MGWHSRWAVAPRAWPDISTSQATSANFLRGCSTRKAPRRSHNRFGFFPIFSCPRQGQPKFHRVSRCSCIKFFIFAGSAGSPADSPILVSIGWEAKRNHIDERQLNTALQREGFVNLVVVSNRVARGKANEPMTGGLAAALLPVVENSGAIWVGSSGRVREGSQKEPFAEIEALGSGALALLDLPAAHYGGYYEGFANSALWPALHSRSDLIRVSQGDYLSYREVNAFMARALLRFNKPDTAFWVQDYHFLALGAELRDLGVTAPIGFFLHTPWPASSVVE